MTKKITPNFLRQSIVLIIFLQSLNFFSQNSVYLSVNWPSYSGENKIELINSSSNVVISLTNDYTDNSNSNFNGNSSTVDLPSGNYIVKVYDRYGDDWNGTSPFGKVFVDTVEAFSFDGNFTNNSGTAYTEISLEYPITIGNIDDASFNYTKASYCQIEANQTPTITGEAGGTFASTAGLILNNTTGEIDTTNSTLGNYVVTYTTTAPDQNSATQNITISDGDVATLEYTRSKSVQDSADLTPTITGVSGNFSSTSGLSINTTSGIIDVSNSTIGTYIVTYTTSGSCSKTYTDEVEILAPFPGVSQYLNSSKKYIEYIPGNMPVIISAPHGGVLQAGSEDCCLSSSTYPHNDSDLNIRNCGTDERDDNTDILIREIQKRSYEQYGLYPHIIINNLHRSKLDPNRDRAEATCNSTGADKYYDAFHNFIDDASAEVDAKFGKGLYIDLHGQSHSVPRIEAGYNLPSSSFDENLNNAATNAEELSRVTIKNLIENNLQNLSFEDLIRGSQSLGGLFQTTGGSEYLAISSNTTCNKTAGYRTVPSHISSGSSQGTCDDTNPGIYDYFAGDFYNNIRHGSGSTSKSNSIVGAGGNLNGGGGTIDGIMTEVNRRVRDIGTDYSSFSYPYNRTDGRTATVPHFSRDYGTVIKTFIDLHYNDFSKFTYDATSYSTKGIDVTPTINGISGGTFSSTSGLTINSSTGKIDVSASTPGTYMITYTAPNVGTYYKKESQITINTDEVTNEFTASSGNWSLSTNWSLNRAPIVTDNVSIPAGKTAFLDGNQLTINDISVIGSLTINTDRSLNVNGDLNNTGSFTINSGGSIIVAGTATGNLTYHRNLDGNKWYLIGAPLANQTVTDFVTTHPFIARGSGSGTNRNVALATFDNTKTFSERWNYYKVGKVDGLNGDDTTDLMTSGLGYTTRVTTATELSFTGVLRTENVQKTISQGTNSFNLVANPYPSYVNSADFLSANTDAEGVDTGKSLKTQTLWIWNQNLNGGLGDYDTRVSIQNFQIAPGQAFFVEAKNGNDIIFYEASQNHQNTDTFLKSSRPEIKLNITDGSNSKFTEVYYIDGTTTGFDNGYDGEIFGGASSSFQIFTGLVSNDSSKKLSIQSIPNSNHETMIIPIGISADAGSEITFTTENKNIPSNLNVYLEDKSKNTFTNLNEITSEYKIQLTEALNGFGNFYLHTRGAVLNSENETLNTVGIFNTDKNKIFITGIVAKNVGMELFNILGKKVFTSTFSSNGNSEIQLPKLAKGVYIVKLKSNTSKINKKIILE